MGTDMIRYKVYYINLDKSIKRREFMENQFNKLNIPLTRMPAVYGKELPKHFLVKAKKEHLFLAHFPYLNDGEIGLIKTYFDLFKIIENQDEEYAIILEDDALVDKSLFQDLPNILNEINNNSFLDISGKKGFYKLAKKELVSCFLLPPLQTTGQIIGKKAATKLLKNIKTFYAPIDVIKQDIFKHRTSVLVTNKKYVKSNDKNLGGTTLQVKNKPVFKKIIREIIRPFWQLISLLTYKLNRFFRNYLFYKNH